MSKHTQDWVQKWSIYSPDKVGLKEIETGRELTYKRWDQQANQLAYYLKDTHQIKKGDRIGILSENVLELYILFAVAQKMGCILVPMNYRLAAAEITYLIQDAEPTLLFVENQFRSKVEDLVGIELESMEALRLYCDGISQEDGPSFPVEKVDEDDPIFILYTSGTTGFPKGAMYTHKMLFWNSINTAMSLIINSDSRTINCLPPFHTAGWNVLTTPLIHHGGYTCLLKKFDSETVLGLIESEQATIFMAVPTVLGMMADLPTFEEVDLSSLLYIIVGGEPMPIPLIERYHQKDIPIRQGYGMTEVGPNLTSLHQSDAIRKKGSIGRSNFYVQTKVVNSEGLEVPAGASGELLLKGPMVTPGYWNKPEASAKAIVDGWFHTGDMVIKDEDDYFYVVDRIKNMYISGGENVYPAEVERVMGTYPSIREVAVIGVPDEKWGEVGAAFVVLGSDETTIPDIRIFCQSKLAKFKVPKYFHIVAELPKNDTGKLDRVKIKAMVNS